MQEERHEHRPINRGCGGHYGYKDDCPQCNQIRERDEELVRKFHEEQKLKEKEKHG